MKYGATIAPAAGMVLVTSPHDDTTYRFNSLLIVDGGDVEFMDEQGNVILLESVPAWTLLPVRVSRVMADTTATIVYGFVS